MVDERVRFLGFTEEQLGVGRHAHAGLVRQHGCILADQVLVHHELAPVLAGRNERDLG